MPNITITIPDNKLNEFRTHFLLAAPKGDFGGTDLEWFRDRIKDHCVSIYRKGKRMATDVDYQDVII